MDIALVTTGRADYGLLYPLIRALQQDGAFNARLVATGSHLSPLHGHTIDQIRVDGLEVSAEVEMTGSGDSESEVCDAIARGLSGFSRLFEETRPDLALVLGDRYELLAVCIAAAIHRIPIAHLHGGESTRGLIDDPVRHSVTKMAALHFPSIEAYARRIIQMGEDPARVFAVGALGIDNILNTPLMDVKELSAFAGVDFEDRQVALLTYHPVTLDDYALAGQQMRAILEALLETELFGLVTMPNADSGGQAIFEVIQEYAGKFPARLRLVKSLGQRAYLSALKYARLMIGNSSSGIIESASFHLPVVNIGDRQGGRYKPANVIDCQCTREEIAAALRKALSPEFARAAAGIENPYGDGHTAGRIVAILKTIDFSDKTALLKKGFHDIEY